MARTSRQLQKKAFSSTFGSLLKLLTDCSDLSTLFAELNSLKKSRDYFAHHFFREDLDKMFSDDARLALIHRMNLLRIRVKHAETKTDAVADRFFKSLYPQVDMETIVADTMENLKAEATVNRSWNYGWQGNR